MHVPIQVDYGVRALVDLAEHQGEGPVHASDIAGRQAIPEPFLARVLLVLSRHGLVSSYRGPQGGHTLGMDPAKISMGMVMDYLGGTHTLVTCMEDLNNCGISANCTQREVWRVVEEAVHNILDSMSIADLVERVIIAKRGLASVS